MIFKLTKRQKGSRKSRNQLNFGVIIPDLRKGSRRKEEKKGVVV
jgi:hypothetical protein